MRKDWRAAPRVMSSHTADRLPALRRLIATVAMGNEFQNLSGDKDHRQMSGGVESRHAGEQRAIQRSGSRIESENDDTKMPRYHKGRDTGIRCPDCKQTFQAVIDSRTVFGGTVIRRRRVCGRCGYRFTTRERIAAR